MLRTSSMRPLLVAARSAAQPNAGAHGWPDAGPQASRWTDEGAYSSRFRGEIHRLCSLGRRLDGLPTDGSPHGWARRCRSWTSAATSASGRGGSARHSTARRTGTPRCRCRSRGTAPSRSRRPPARCGSAPGRPRAGREWVRCGLTIVMHQVGHSRAQIMHEVQFGSIRAMEAVRRHRRLDPAADSQAGHLVRCCRAPCRSPQTSGSGTPWGTIRRRPAAPASPGSLAPGQFARPAHQHLVACAAGSRCTRPATGAAGRPRRRSGRRRSRAPPVRAVAPPKTSPRLSMTGSSRSTSAFSRTARRGSAGSTSRQTTRNTGQRRSSARRASRTGRSCPQSRRTRRLPLVGGDGAFGVGHSCFSAWVRASGVGGQPGGSSPRR